MRGIFSGDRQRAVVQDATEVAGLTVASDRTPVGESQVRHFGRVAGRQPGWLGRSGG